MKHYIFVLKVKEKSGSIKFFTAQRLDSNKKLATNRVAAKYSQMGIVEQIIDMGECDSGSPELDKLYDAACAKAAKMESKSSSTPAQ